MSSERRTLLLITALTAVFFSLLAPRFAARLDPLTGDEPFYVMTAISLVRDHDLNEANNYADRDYDEFYPPDPLPAGWEGWPAFPRTLPPHPAHSVLPGLHTKHALGLALLIAVPYEVAGRGGAMAVLIIATTLLAGQMYLLAREAGASERIAAVVALGLIGTMPIAPYGLLLFPEIPAALALVYAIRRLSVTENRWWQWLLTGLAVGFLPWLHQRFAPTAAVLGVFMLWRLWQSRKATIALACLVVGVGAAGIVGYNWWLYHSPLQNIADHAGFSSATGTVNGLFGLLLDAQWGLIVNAPVYLIAAVALPRWFRVDRRRALLAIAAITPYAIEVSAYRVWWGEWGPAARYLVPIAPLAAATLAALLATSGRAVRWMIAATWLLSMWLTSIGLADPQRFYHQPNGVNNLITRAGETIHLDIASRLVAFQPYALSPRVDRVMAGLLLVLAMWLVAAVVYVLPLRRRSTVAPIRTDRTKDADTLPS